MELVTEYRYPDFYYEYLNERSKHSYVPDSISRTHDILLDGWTRYLENMTEDDIKQYLPKPVKRKSHVSSKKEEPIQDRMYYYSITFTHKDPTVDMLENDLSKIISSEMFKIVKVKIGRELHENGHPYYHLMTTSVRPIYASDLKKLHLGRFDIKKLRTKLDVSRWDNYISKGLKDPDGKAKDYFFEYEKELVEEIVI